MRNHEHRSRGSWVWFLLVGWWLGLAWLCVALLFICTIIGAPAGFEMLENLPAVVALA